MIHCTPHIHDSTAHVLESWTKLGDQALILFSRDNPRNSDAIWMIKLVAVLDNGSTQKMVDSRIVEPGAGLRALGRYETLGESIRWEDFLTMLEECKR